LHVCIGVVAVFDAGEAVPVTSDAESAAVDAAIAMEASLLRSYLISGVERTCSMSEASRLSY
jgi:hypothetical protein